MLIKMKLKRLIENWLFNTILNLIRTIKSTERNSMRLTKLTMRFIMTHEGKTMILIPLVRWLLIEQITYLRTSGVKDTINLMMTSLSLLLKIAHITETMIEAIEMTTMIPIAVETIEIMRTEVGDMIMIMIITIKKTEAGEMNMILINITITEAPETGEMMTLTDIE